MTASIRFILSSGDHFFALVGEDLVGDLLYGLASGSSEVARGIVKVEIEYRCGCGLMMLLSSYRPEGRKEKKSSKMKRVPVLRSIDHVSGGLGMQLPSMTDCVS